MLPETVRVLATVEDAEEMKPPRSEESPLANNVEEAFNGPETLNGPTTLEDAVET